MLAIDHIKVHLYLIMVFVFPLIGNIIYCILVEKTKSVFDLLLIGCLWYVAVLLVPMGILATLLTELELAGYIKLFVFLSWLFCMILGLKLAKNKFLSNVVKP
ncbi:MAG: hypothetical protein CVV64_13660 [Candidatus Wallbacteria bacterium HGW-Wallbacteria-1]|jgi:hypothetical protein|uniref:DUF4870 domain-containing protein n=1 Tax=Candidatus Wallbacteria bacterium HGW-Wallbacteria-1 TaxID=2013854 RepID=A0A2N1PMP6_9BACT|nr:MAG: hypothetical protein CVV64_13660 [Candidatus Wallbacteria bacterium HGW-Wallbacteria-1]